MGTPAPVFRTALCVGASLIGDSALYVVLPVVYASRGLSPMQVGIILSANRWTRLFTNAPAAWLLGVYPVRATFATSLLVGGCCSFLYCSTSLTVVVLARCLWGACWSILRLTGMLTVTDTIDSGLAPETIVGRLTGTFSGVSRLGSALGMALGGVLSDRISYEAFFSIAGLLTVGASPFAWGWTFGSLPMVSVTAARKVATHQSSNGSSDGGAPVIRWLGILPPRCVPRLTRAQWQLMALAFSASCAGNGLIVSTLGVLLGSYSRVDPATGQQFVTFGRSMRLGTATLNGLLLGGRWAIEGCGAPWIGRLIDRLGWPLVAPAAFGLSSLNGALGFTLLRMAEAASGESSGLLLTAVLACVVVFFVLVSTADLCVKAMGVSRRETTLLVQGDDLGSAVGPVLGYAILQMQLPASSVLAAQCLIHGTAGLIALSAARFHWASVGGVATPLRARGRSSTSSEENVELQQVALRDDDESASKAMDCDLHLSERVRKPMEHQRDNHET